MALLYDSLTPEQRNIIGSIGPKFDVTNVADYYYQTDREYYNLYEDFPLPRPPFKSMWVEYRMPKRIYSKEVGETLSKLPESTKTYFGGFAIEKGSEAGLREIQYVNTKTKERVALTGGPGTFGIYGNMWAVDEYKGATSVRQITSMFAMKYNIGDRGNISEAFFRTRSDGTPYDPNDLASECYIIHPILMAFSYSNCKNIETVTVKPPEKLNKRRLERGKLPLTDYRIINILPFGKCYRPQSREASTTSKHLSIPIRRGYYARYGDEFGHGKLFGKYEGMFWRPQIALDREKASAKTYAVAGPKGENGEQ